MKIFSLCMAVILALAVPLCRAAEGEEGEEENKDLTPRERETERVTKIMNWALANQVSKTEMMQRIFVPLAKANLRDSERNQQMAGQFSEMAKEAQRNRQQEAARKYHAVAELLRESARQNRRFAEGYKETNFVAMRQALKVLYTNDDRIEQIMGKRIERNWYCLPELLETPSGTGGTGAGGGQNGDAQAPAAEAARERE